MIGLGVVKTRCALDQILGRPDSARSLDFARLQCAWPSGHRGRAEYDLTSGPRARGFGAPLPTARFADGYAATPPSSSSYFMDMWT